MIKIGNKELFFNTTIFVPVEEEAELEIKVSDRDIMFLKFAFQEDPEIDGQEKRKTFFKLEGEGDTGKLTFVNWTETFGSSITTPAVIAKSDDGKEISFLGSIVKIGKMYKVEFQLMKDIH